MRRDLSATTAPGFITWCQSPLSLLRGSDLRLALTRSAQAAALHPQTVTQRAFVSSCSGVMPRATSPAAMSLPGENLGSIGGPGERVERIDRVTQHNVERH